MSQAESTPSNTPHLLDLPAEVLVAALCDCRVCDILRFSEVSSVAHTISGDAQIWEPLFRARHWLGGSVVQLPSVPTEWRAAYCKAARTESPFVLQLEDFRTLAGFARDLQPTAAGLWWPTREHVVADAIDAAISAVGHLGTEQLRGADVIVVVGVLDGCERVEQMLRHVFSCGARRARLVDAALAAMRCAGASSGTVLFIDLERVTAACVVDGQRLPVRRQVTGPGLRRAIDYLADNSPPPPPPRPAGGGMAAAAAATAAAAAAAAGATPSISATSPQPCTTAALTHAALAAMTGSSNWHTSSSRAVAAVPAAGAMDALAAADSTTQVVASASSAAVAPANPANGSTSSVEEALVCDATCHEVGGDLAWLLQHHCYVRAVGTARRPVSAEETAMAACVLRAPSGRKWPLAEQRFMAFEQLFIPPPPPAPPPALTTVQTPTPTPAPPIDPSAVAPSSTQSTLAQPAALVCAESLPAERARVAGSGWAAALALANGNAECGALGGEGAPRRGSGGVAAAGSPIDVLRVTIEQAGNREHMNDLFGAIVLAGPGGSLPGLRQRLESELRAIRHDPEMPRALRPRLLETGAAARGYAAVDNDLLRGGGDAPSSSVGGVGKGGDVASTGGHASVWRPTEAETLAWRGAAADACAQLSEMGGAYSSTADPGWVYPGPFKKEPRQATRLAMKAAGCPIDRGSESVNACASLGGHWGGSGIVRRML